MDGRDVGIYLMEAETQCRLVHGAVLALNQALQANAQKPEGEINWEQMAYVQREVFRSLHSLLTHASNVSRLFWPPGGDNPAAMKRKERGRMLRSKVGLPDDGHPLHKRTLRDHLEHFDERIDLWRETSVRKNYVQDAIAPKGSIQGLEETDMMRWYDPAAKTFRFRGEEYNIQELVASVDALLPLLKPAAEAAEREARDARS